MREYGHTGIRGVPDQQIPQQGQLQHSRNPQGGSLLLRLFHPLIFKFDSPEVFSVIYANFLQVNQDVKDIIKETQELNKKWKREKTAKWWFLTLTSLISFVYYRCGTSNLLFC